VILLNLKRRMKEQFLPEERYSIWIPGRHCGCRDEEMGWFENWKFVSFSNHTHCYHKSATVHLKFAPFHLWTPVFSNGISQTTLVFKERSSLFFFLENKGGRSHCQRLRGRTAPTPAPFCKPCSICDSRAHLPHPTYSSTLSSHQTARAPRPPFTATKNKRELFTASHLASQHQDARRREPQASVVHGSAANKSRRGTTDRYSLTDCTPNLLPYPAAASQLGLIS
jgi:hypothetical protein